MRLFATTLILLLYALLCFWSWQRYRRAYPQSGTFSESLIGEHTWLIAYASQTGTAESFARKTMDQLRQVGEDALMLSLNQITDNVLQKSRRALFIVSTYGEGEAPDNGNRFLRRLANMNLGELQHGVLALGDRSYRHFCGFGHQLQQALVHCEAPSLFDMIEVDQGEPSGLRHWQYYLGEVSGQRLFFDWSKPEYQHWLLTERSCLNVGSPGAPTFHLRLQPATDNIAVDHWQAGDIAEIGPGNSDQRIADFLQALGRKGGDPLQANGQSQSLADALRYRNLPTDAKAQSALMGLDNHSLLENLPELPHREYSIASTPAQGTLDLLVRQVREGDELGLGSGWLTDHTQVNDPIRLRVRLNHNFHSPPASTPMILIGNGTGIAGLRAHLQARSTESNCRNWLLFGERTAAHDFFFGDEIRDWQQSGNLERLDLAFSRENGGTARYVQDLLPPAADEIRRWVEAGASIYVCGSLRGMAEGVHQALTIILGADTLDALAENHRYCRDVY